MAKEKKYYKVLQKWLRRNGYYFEKEWKDIGISKYRVDVIGIKNISEGWSFDNIEIVAMEAKKWLEMKSLSQAENYFDVANKVYVVQVEDADHVQDKIRLSCLSKNLGLITVKGKRYTEVIEAPPVQRTNEATRMRFLEKLHIIKCILCGKYFNYDKEDNAFGFRSPRRFKAKFRLIERAMCEYCSKHDMGQKAKDLAYDLYNDLWDRIEKLEKRHKRLEKRINELE